MSAPRCKKGTRRCRNDCIPTEQMTATRRKLCREISSQNSNNSKKLKQISNKRKSATPKRKKMEQPHNRTAIIELKSKVPCPEGFTETPHMLRKKIVRYIYETEAFSTSMLDLFKNPKLLTKYVVIGATAPVPELVGFGFKEEIIDDDNPPEGKYEYYMTMDANDYSEFDPNFVINTTAIVRIRITNTDLRDND